MNRSKNCTVQLFLCIFCFGFASGIPMGLSVSALNAWLAKADLANVNIGVFAALSFPYTFKFVFAPFIDHLQIPFLSKKMGKKRSWLFVMQILLFASLIMLSRSNPMVNLYYMGFWTLCVTFFASLNEIILDDYRISILSSGQQSAGSSVTLFGNRMGFLFGSGFVLFAVDYLCSSYDVCQNSENWKAVYKFTSIFTFVGLFAAIFLGEPKSKTNNKHTKSGSIMKKIIMSPIKEISKIPNYAFILIFVSLYRVCDAFINPMINPFLIDLEFSLIEIAVVEKTFGIAAMMFGIFLGGLCVHRFGILKTLFFGGLMQAFSNLMFVLQSKIGHNVPFLYITIATENASGSIANTALISCISCISQRCRLSGSVYALLSSLIVINTLFLPIVSGFVVDNFGWNALFNTSVILGLPSIFVLLVIKAKNQNANQAFC